MPESEAPRPGGIRQAWDEVDLLRGSPDAGGQGPGHQTRVRVLDRLRRAPEDRAHDPRPERWVKWVLLGVLFAAIVGATGWFVYGMLVDQGEILLFSDEPMPGQSGRIARMSIVRIDDADAFRARVTEDTRVIIIAPGREAELGSEWVSEQYRQGIVIIRLSDELIGTDWRGQEIRRMNIAYQSCVDPRIRGGGMGQWGDWQSFKINLDWSLTNQGNLRCR